MKFFIKKLITLIITLLLISFLTFTAFSVIPGDAALSRLGKDASEQQVEALREEMGLNDSLPVRYVRWIGGAVTGDFGESYRYEGISVSSLLSDRLPVTVLLSVIALVIILVCSVPLGIASARHAGEWGDVVTNQLTQIIMAIPPFFSGDDTDLRIWPDTSFIPAREVHPAVGKSGGSGQIPVFSGFGHCTSENCNGSQVFAQLGDLGDEQGLCENRIQQGKHKNGRAL